MRTRETVFAECEECGETKDESLMCNGEDEEIDHIFCDEYCYSNWSTNNMLNAYFVQRDEMLERMNRG